MLIVGIPIILAVVSLGALAGWSAAGWLTDSLLGGDDDTAIPGVLWIVASIVVVLLSVAALGAILARFGVWKELAAAFGKAGDVVVNLADRLIEPIKGLVTK